MVMGELPSEADVVVVGAGPGGYAAAFRAAELGCDVTLVSDDTALGGVCLLRGCIPSKALLGISELLHRTEAAAEMGVSFQEPEIDLETTRAWKDSVVEGLAKGLEGLCERREIRVVHGRARFESADSVRIAGESSSTVTFKHAVIATGTLPAMLPETDTGERIVDSTGALELADVPERLLVVGGGYVGLELGQVYAKLGSRVTLVEMTDRLMPTCDADLVKPLAKRLETDFEAIRLHTEVAALEEKGETVQAHLDDGTDTAKETFDRVLIAIGRVPNTADLGLDAAGVEIDDQGYIKTSAQCQTANERIFAIGDVSGGAQLAHQAIMEGKVAAEAIVGKPTVFDALAVPAVVYTEPQIAWCGLTEQQADGEGRDVTVKRFPWRNSGRARTIGETDGLTKLVFDRATGRIVGMGAVGHAAESLVAEGVLAIEMGAVAEDLALSIHAHPTLAETVGEAAELFLGMATHMHRASSE